MFVFLPQKNLEKSDNPPKKSAKMYLGTVAKASVENTLTDSSLGLGQVKTVYTPFGLQTEGLITGRAAGGQVAERGSSRSAEIRTLPVGLAGGD
jgi:hypothetical protein